jgi:hypothetical protein
MSDPRADRLRVALVALDRERQLLDGRDYVAGELRDNLTALAELLVERQQDKAALREALPYVEWFARADNEIDPVDKRTAETVLAQVAAALVDEEEK